MPVTRATKYKSTRVAAASTIANTTVETDFTPQFAIPRNTMRPGKTYRLTARGVYSSIATSPGTYSIKVKSSSTVYRDNGNVTLSTSQTNVGWMIQFDIICNSTGASGSVEANGHGLLANSGTTAHALLIRNTAAVTIDTTVDQLIKLAWQFSVADPGNTVTLREFIVEELG